MKKFGYFLLIAGFLLATYTTALDVESVNWLMFTVAAFSAINGVLLVKRHERGTAKSATVLSANRAELSDSLGKIVSNLEDMSGEGQAISTDSMRDAIDSRLRDDLRRFADARETLIHLFGLQLYANLMSNFAAGERYINRVWSASADGYDAEARNYLRKAATQFRNAQDQLQAASA